MKSRVEWARFQEREKQKEEEAREKERGERGGGGGGGGRGQRGRRGQREEGFTTPPTINLIIIQIVFCFTFFTIQ